MANLSIYEAFRNSLQMQKQELFDACKKGLTQTVIRLLREEVEFSENCFLIACEYRHADIIKLLIDAGADVRNRDFFGSTGLHMAVFRPKQSDEDVLTVVDILIDAGADVNATTFNKRETPLTMAAESMSFKIVKRLLAAGADPNIVSDSSQSPLYIAASKLCSPSETMRQDAFDIMRCLLNAGANPNNMTDGVNALFPSVFSCNLLAVKMLLEAGTDPLHIEPVSQHTLLHELTSAHKISPECLQIAQLLLDAGVDKTALNESGKLAYDYVDTSASNTSLQDLLKVDFINESSVSEPPELQTAPLYHIISLDEIQPGQEYYLIGVGKKMYFFASEEDLSEFKQHDKLYLQSNGSRMTHPVWRKPIHLSQLKKTSRYSYL